MVACADVRVKPVHIPWRFWCEFVRRLFVCFLLLFRQLDM